MANPLSFAFWNDAPAGSPLSYEALQTRRKIAEQLMGKRSPFPKTFGEGLTYLGEGIGDAMQMNRLDAAEKQQAAYEKNVLSGGPPLPGSENTAVAPAAPPAARPVSDAGTDTTAPVQTAAAPGQPLDVTPSKFANVRYNNPGAQYPVSGENATAFGQQGAGIIGGGHKIAQFPTPVHGAAANMDLLDRNYTGMRIGAAINKWSGGARRNVPGFNTDTVITSEMMRDPAFAIPFMQAVAGGEAPGRYPMSDEKWAEAYNMFTDRRGGMPPPLPPTDPRGRITQAVVDQAEPDSAPVRTAALTAPGVTSDASPASAIADGASTAVAALPVQPQPPTQTPPLIPGSGPPIPSAIPKAPEQVAQAGSQPAPTLGPSQEPIPPASLPDIPELKVLQDRPKPLGPRPEETHWQRVMNLPGISDRGRAYAAQQLSAWQEHRKELDKQQQEDFTHQRGKDEAANLLRDKIIRDMPKEQQEEYIRRLNAEKMKATNPYEEQKIQAEINKTLLEIEQKKLDLVKPDVREQGGQFYERPQGPVGTPFTEVKGISKPEKLNEEQAKALRYWERAYVTDQQIGDSRVLGVLKDVALGKIPIAGNYAVTSAYRSAKSKADQWLLANVRHESGASIRPDEIPEFYHNYFPVPGDDEKLIEEKDVRRNQTNKSVYDSLGDVRHIGDRFVEDRKARRVTESPEVAPERSIRVNKNGEKQIHLNGYWEDLPQGWSRPNAR